MNLLTTRQLQELLRVDRVTIYRMLSDGRLRGFKVGGQWRFSRAEIEAWLQQQRAALEVTEVPPPTEEGLTTSQTLPLSCIQAIQELVAESLGVSIITTDLQGQPLTKPGNPCRFCLLIQSTKSGQERCRASWRTLAAMPSRRNEPPRCHAGLFCLQSRIEIEKEDVALIFAEQFLTGPVKEGKDSLLSRLSELAEACGVSESKLRAALPTIHQVEKEDIQQISHLLHKTAQIFSEIGQERLELLNRLRRIAEISAL